MVSREKAIQLIRKYEPVLFLDKEEPDIPVHPGRFMEHSALWQAQPYRDPAGKHLRANWKPLIRKGLLTLNPAKHNQPMADFPDELWRLDLNPSLEREDSKITPGDILLYPGSSAVYQNNPQDGFLFLNFAGWSHENLRRCDIDKSRNLYSNLPSLTDGQYRFRYFAKVLDLTGLQALLLDIKDTMKGESWIQWLTGFLDDKWIIWYYFFFPVHDEGKTGIYSYEGDWTSVAVIVEKPFLADERPTYIGVSHRTRGNCPENLKYFQPIVDIIAGPMQVFWQKMEVAAWDAVTKAPGTLHPRIYVTKGTHNLYLSPGDHNPQELPVFGSFCEITAGGDEELTKIVNKVEDILSDAEVIAISAVKFFSIPFPFNLIAMACESNLHATGKQSPYQPPKEDREEKTPSEGDWGCIIKPAAMDRKLLFEPSEMERWGWDPVSQDQKLNSLDVRDWTGTDDEVLIREMDIWWPVVDGNTGYQGLWGTVMEMDSFEYRSGMPFPAFDKAFLVGLGLTFNSP